MFPIPTHLKEILQVDEAAFKRNNHALDGKIQCTCGCDIMKLKIYAEQNEGNDYICVKHYKTDYGLRISGMCVSCKKTYDLFDMAKHGYNGFVCHDGEAVDDADLKDYYCPICQHDHFQAAISLELEDIEQFQEEVVEDLYLEEQYAVEDFVDAFNWINIDIQCEKCGTIFKNWVNFETS